MKFKNIRTNFFTDRRSEVKSSGSHFHEVVRGKLKGSGKTWIRKTELNHDKAKIEMLAQEFFRLIIPHQPETRLMRDPTNNYNYILSEEIPDYKPLPNERQNFSNGSYTHLGEILLVSLYLQETDLNLGNIGLDHKNRVTKIDSDWCFSQKQLHHREDKFPLTSKSIENVLIPESFFPYNWLDYVIENECNWQSSIVENRLKNTDFFRNEVNQALLKICLVPDAFIEPFVTAIMGDGSREFIDFIKQRRNELQEIAKQNHSFQTYIKTPQAKKDIHALIINMNSFVMNADTKVIPDKGQEKMVVEVIASQFDALQTEIEAEIDRVSLDLDVSYKAGRIIFKANQYLDEMLVHRVPGEDPLVDSYVETMRQALVSAETEAVLKDLFGDIEKKHRAVCSPEAQAVLKAAQDLRNSISLKTVGKAKKASRIEDALRKTPLDKRLDVITRQCSPANKVQKALASHRSWGKRNRVYTDSRGQINFDKAAKTYKQLKRDLEEIREKDKPENESSDSLTSSHTQKR